LGRGFPITTHSKIAEPFGNVVDMKDGVMETLGGAERLQGEN